MAVFCRSEILLTKTVHSIVLRILLSTEPVEQKPTAVLFGLDASVEPFA